MKRSDTRVAADDRSGAPSNASPAAPPRPASEPSPRASPVCAEAEAVVRSAQLPWRTRPTPGASVRVPRRDPDRGAATVLVRLDAAARFPVHDHPDGEEVLGREADRLIGRARLQAGDYLSAPPDGRYAASSAGSCTFLVTLPKPVRFL